MLENYDNSKFTRMFQNIPRLDLYNNRKGINKVT